MQGAGTSGPETPPRSQGQAASTHKGSLEARDLLFLCHENWQATHPSFYACFTSAECSGLQRPTFHAQQTILLLTELEIGFLIALDSLGLRKEFYSIARTLEVQGD